MIGILVIITLLLQLSSGGEVKSIDLVPGKINIQAGSRLEIPCRFSIKDQADGDKILLEWGMMAKESRAYHSVALIYNPLKEEVNVHDQRAHVFVTMIPSGNCSLVIDPVISEDNGLYELHLSINDDEYDSPPIVYVNVLEGDDDDQDITTQNIHRGSRPTNFKKIKDLFQVDLVKSPVRSALYIGAWFMVGLIILGVIVACIIWFTKYWPKQLEELRKLEEANGSSPSASLCPSVESGSPPLTQTSLDGASFPLASPNFSVESRSPPLTRTSQYKALSPMPSLYPSLVYASPELSRNLLDGTSCLSASPASSDSPAETAAPARTTEDNAHQIIAYQHGGQTYYYARVPGQITSIASAMSFILVPPANSRTP